MRRSGILLPLTCLPSNHGVGTLGIRAYDFVDFLAASGQSLWQILPIGPTGAGDSPYQCFSAFAGNPYNIDLDFLFEEKLLTKRDLKKDWGSEASSADYDLQLKFRIPLLQKAATKLDVSNNDYTAFRKNNDFWLEDFALFMSVKYEQDWAPLSDWHDRLRLPSPSEMAALRRKYEKESEIWRRIQFLFFEQWVGLKRYANAKGIGIIGDLAFYVSYDSSDLWANPSLFEMDENGRPSVVAGVPPDGFSGDGQTWNNPLYDWKTHIKSGYAWWLERVRQANKIYDHSRLDHFRGLSEYYSIPTGASAAYGKWMPGPGKDFINTIKKKIPGFRMIAEDLGVLTDDVRELLSYSGYPGMDVMQFAFSPDEESSYLPHNHIRNSIVYTGTHDNNTLAGWVNEMDSATVAHAMAYLGVDAKKRLPRAMIRAAFSSVSDTAIVPLQDWLGLGASARINRPSTIGNGNWKWRLLPEQLTDALASEILEFTTLYGRAMQAPEF